MAVLLVVVLEEPVHWLFQLGKLFGGSFFGLSLALQPACGSKDLDGFCRRLAGTRPAVSLSPLPRRPPCSPPPSLARWRRRQRGLGR
jgi:hypothetical protein